MDMDASTTRTGPLFDGRASKAAADFAEDASRAVAEAGVNEIQARLSTVLVHPTGAYSGGIRTDRAQADNVISDGGAVYGPWLEGVASRNTKSRFKGYSTFRKAKQWLEGQAVAIAEDNIRPYLTRMGGE